jgi:hypothetical protein
MICFYVVGTQSLSGRTPAATSEAFEFSDCGETEVPIRRIIVDITAGQVALVTVEKYDNFTSGYLNTTLTEYFISQSTCHDGGGNLHLNLIQTGDPISVPAIPLGIDENADRAMPESTVPVIGRKKHQTKEQLVEISKYSIGD